MEGSTMDDSQLHQTDQRGLSHDYILGGGGGGFKIFWKSGGICMARGDLSYSFTRGFGGMLPRENLKKWCNPT